MSVSSGAFSALTGWQFTGGDMDRSIFYLTKEAWQKIANPSGSNNGWQNNGDTWQYYENGLPVKSAWRKVDNKWYYLDTSGNVLTNWQKINDHWYYFNTNHDGSFGAALTGWQKINGKEYYFDPDNAWMLTGKQEIEGSQYNFGDDGALVTTENQSVDNQPAKPTDTETRLSAADREAIENELKYYIQATVRDEILKVRKE